MRKTIAKIILGILIIIVSMLFAGLTEGGLGIFILTLLFVFFVSRFYGLMRNKTNTLTYKFIIGGIIALIISLIFYILFGVANRGFTFDGLFIFFMKAIQVTVLPIAIGLVLLINNSLRKPHKKLKEPE